MGVSKFYKTNTFYLLLLILLLFPSIYSLFHTGFFVSDDGEWMIIRLSAFYETLKTGQIPVRFIERLNNGYGYPLANFMYPSYLYIGSILHLVGFGFVASVKIILGTSMVLSGVFVYLWLQKLYTRLPAAIGALLYVYMPYHVFDLFIRGSIGEVLALAVVPFILWQIERKDMVMTSCGIGMLVLSHNTMAFLFLIPLFIYALIRNKTKGFLNKFLLTSVPFLLGLCLSGFFWIPALYDLQYTIFRSVTIADWQKYFANFELVGYATIVVFISTLFCVCTKRFRLSPYKKEVIFFLSVGIFSLCIALPISSFFWEIIPSSFIQFPFRALSLLIPSLAFLCAFILSFFSTRMQPYIGMIFLLIAIVSCIPFFTPKEFIDKGDMYYISNFSTTTVKNEYMPKWVKKDLPGLPPQKIEIVTGDGVIVEKQQSFNSLTAQVSLKKESIVQINTVYFPGWTVLVDGKETEILYDNPYGLIQLKLPQGDYVLEAKFTETSVRLVADFFSLLATGVLLFLFVRQVRYNKTTKHI